MAANAAPVLHALTGLTVEPEWLADERLATPDDVPRLTQARHIVEGTLEGHGCYLAQLPADTQTDLISDMAKLLSRMERVARRVVPKAEPEPERPFVTVTEAARRLGLDPRTVRSLVCRHELDGWRYGRVWRVDANAVDAYLRRQRDAA